MPNIFGRGPRTYTDHWVMMNGRCACWWPTRWKENTRRARRRQEPIIKHTQTHAHRHTYTQLSGRRPLVIVFSRHLLRTFSRTCTTLSLAYIPTYLYSHGICIYILPVCAKAQLCVYVASVCVYVYLGPSPGVLLYKPCLLWLLSAVQLSARRLRQRHFLFLCVQRPYGKNQQQGDSSPCA